MAETMQRLAEAYSLREITSLEFIENLLYMASGKDSPSLTSALSEMSGTIFIPSPVTRLAEDIDQLASEMQESKVSQGYEFNVRKRLREIIWVKHRIKDHSFYETAYGYIARYYADAAD